MQSLLNWAAALVSAEAYLVQAENAAEYRFVTTVGPQGIIVSRERVRRATLARASRDYR
jgi:hypothetical protein